MKNFAVRSCLLLFALWVLNLATVSAQVRSGLYEVGITGGIFVYQGDLAPSALGSYRTAGKAFSLMGERILSNAYGLRANIAYGRLNGRDAAFSSPEWKRQRNFLFTS